MQMYKAFQQNHRKLASFAAYTFFALALSVILSMLGGNSDLGSAAAFAFMLLIMVAFVVAVLVLFKWLYFKYSKWKSGYPQLTYSQARKDTIKAYVVVCVVVLLIYIFMLVFAMVCDKSLYVNKILISGVSSLILPLHSGGINSMLYIIKLMVVMLNFVTALLLACVLAGCDFFKQFRILAGIFVTIAVVIAEAFLDRVFSISVVGAFGGVEKLFVNHPHSAVAIVLLSETVILALLTIVNTLCTKWAMTPRTKRSLIPSRR